MHRKQGRWVTPTTATIVLLILLTTLMSFASNVYAGGSQQSHDRLPQQPRITRDGIIANAKSWVEVPIGYSESQTDLYHGYRKDCSGFVSMAWGLPGPGLVTSTLPNVSYPINKDDLQPGDILNNVNGGGNPDFAHVVIFASWVDSLHTHYNAYEEVNGLPYYIGAHYTQDIPYPYWPAYYNSQLDYIPMRLNSFSNASTPIPITTPSIPVSTPTQPSTLLYSANWSNGLNGWTGSQEWSVSNGQLQSDGTDGNGHFGLDAISPPYRPSTANYAVEAKIQIVNSVYGLGQCYVGIRGRVQNPSTSPSYVGDGYFLGFNGGYNAAMVAYESLSNAPNGGFDMLQSQNFTPGFGWHTYRAEFRGNQMTLFIDGKLIDQVTDSRLPTTGILQLEDGFCPANVSSFQVFAL